MSSPRFLIIRGGAIGDFILTTPVIAAMREQWPNAHIELLGYPHIAGLALAPELLDAVRPISSRGVATFYAEHGEPDSEFREYFRSFQQIISFLYDPDQVFENNMNDIGARRYLKGIHKPVEPEPPVHPIHATKQLVKALESLAIFVEHPMPRLHPQRAERLFAHDFFKGEPARPLVAVHPGSGGEKKLWPIENWIALCRWLVEKKKANLLIVTGEADQANRQRLHTQFAQQHVCFADNLKLPQLAAVIEQANLFIGHDSGISHLAAAVGVPTLALFGPTNPAVWRPLGAKVRILLGSREWNEEIANPFFAAPMTAIMVPAVLRIAEEILVECM
ncbi:MAG: glycosyltransferase family 9 protein [Pedosphaera sp.]|nr:glycosyltransferase family 9 protein [Pedosphaera sp.]